MITIAPSSCCGEVDTLSDFRGRRPAPPPGWFRAFEHTIVPIHSPDVGHGEATVARRSIGFSEIVTSERTLWQVQTAGAGPPGRLPGTPGILPRHPTRANFGLPPHAARAR